MKKIILTLAIVVAVGFAFTSCKNDKKEESKIEDVKTEVSQEVASNEVYQCPMDCEKGKTYDEVGNCPVCKMSLKEKKSEIEDIKTEVSQEVASNEVYQCPMDCEKGKTYDEVGNCPVCKMSLKEKKSKNEGEAEVKMDSENHDGHNHN